MRGRRVVVTGATTGIGKETARALANMGASVVIVGRDAEKLDRTIAELAREGLVVDSARCDFASLASVQDAATALRDRFAEIHVLVNNAGAVFMERGVTHDGIESTLEVNHLAPFLFTRCLLPSLERAARAEQCARVVNVASTIHARASLDWDDIQSMRDYAGLRAYGRTKLMNVMFTYALARRLRAKHVTATCLHPGVVASGFGHNNRGWMGFGVKVVAPLLTTPAKGARTSVFLASSAEVEGVTGRYFAPSFLRGRSREAASSALSRDEAMQEKLWVISEAILRERLWLDG